MSMATQESREMSPSPSGTFKSFSLRSFESKHPPPRVYIPSKPSYLISNKKTERPNEEFCPSSGVSSYLIPHADLGSQSSHESRNIKTYKNIHQIMIQDHYTKLTGPEKDDQGYITNKAHLTLRDAITKIDDIIFIMENELKLTKQNLWLVRSRCMGKLQAAQEVRNKIAKKLEDVKKIIEKLCSKKSTLDSLVTDSMQVIVKMHQELVQTSTKVKKAKYFVKKSIKRADNFSSNPSLESQEIKNHPHEAASIHCASKQSEFPIFEFPSNKSLSKYSKIPLPKAVSFQSASRKSKSTSSKVSSTKWISKNSEISTSMATMLQFASKNSKSSASLSASTKSLAKFSKITTLETPSVQSDSYNF